jgi:hypothetical protein
VRSSVYFRYSDSPAARRMLISASWKD